MSVTMSATPYSNAGNYAHQRPVSPGRLRHEKLSDSDRNISIFMHLSIPIAYFFALSLFAFVAPLVLWKVFRNNSPFLEDQGREATNAALSLALYHVIPPIGLIAAIIFLISAIRGAVANSKNEYFRYPITIRFLSDPPRPETPVSPVEPQQPNNYA